MKYCLLFLLSFSVFYSYSQKVIKIVDVTNPKYSTLPLKYAFELDGNYYFQTFRVSKVMFLDVWRTERLGMAVYDKDLKEINNFELTGTTEKQEVLETFFSNGKIFLLELSKSKKEKFIKLYTYNHEGTLIDQKQMLTMDEDSEVEVLTSGDSSKIAVVVKLDKNSKKLDCQMQACVLDQSGVVLWNSTIDLNSNSSEHSFLKTGVSNTGDLYTIMINELSSKDFNFFLHVSNSSKSDRIQLMPKEYIDLLGIYETKEGVYLTGFNLDLKKNLFINPFLVKLDTKVSKIEIPNHTINQSILQPLITRKYYKEKNGWLNLKMQHGWKNLDGNHSVVFEKEVFSSVNTGNASMNHHGMVFTHIDFKEYYFFTFDDNGIVKSLSVSPKDIRKNAEIFLIPKMNFVYKDDLYAIYNEVEKNVNIAPFGEFKAFGNAVPILRKFSSDGKISDIILDKTKGQYVLPFSGSMLKNGSFIFASCDGYLFRSKDVKIGLVKFN